MRWWAELLGSRVTQSKESDAFASQGVDRLIRPLLPNWADSQLGRFQDHRIRPLCHPPLLSPSFGPYRTDPELDLGVMPTHDMLLVGLRGGRPRNSSTWRGTTISV